MSVLPNGKVVYVGLGYEIVFQNGPQRNGATVGDVLDVLIGYTKRHCAEAGVGDGEPVARALGRMVQARGELEAELPRPEF